MFDATRKFGMHTAVGVLAVAAALCAQAQTGTAAPAVAPAANAAVPANASPSAAAPDRQGTFKTVHGEVTVIHGDTRNAAVVGGPLHASDRVVTGAQGSAVVSLLDGTTIEVGANSTADLAQYHFDSTTDEGSMLVKLAHGTLRMMTGLIAKSHPDQVKVATPTAVIGARGTNFIVEAQ